MQGNAEEIIQRNHSQESLNISDDYSDEDDCLRTPAKFKRTVIKESTTQKKKRESNFQ